LEAAVSGEVRARDIAAAERATRRQYLVFRLIGK